MFSIAQVSPTDPAELRAALAHAGLPAYRVAALAEIHPTRLSRLLRGRQPVPEDIGKRLLRVVQSDALEIAPPCSAAGGQR
jgi:hypothetical protein